MIVATRRDLLKRGGGAAALAALAGGAVAPGTSTASAASRRWRGGSDLPVGYPLGPFVRDGGNPILRPGTQPWESKFVFNPAAVVKDGLLQLLYRAQGPDGRSSIGLATSSDGVHFRRRSQPVLEASEPFELPGGCEDPRVIEVRGTYYMTYTGYDGTSARLALATSRDLVRWKKHGALFPNFQTRDVGKPWSKSGAILNIASTAAFQPGPKMAVYFATKAYVLSFTEALHEELKPHGIRVSCLCPGPTRTEFGEVAGFGGNGMFDRVAMDSPEVVATGLAGLDRNHAVVVAGWMNKVTAASTRFAPRSIVRRIAGAIKY